MSKNKRQKGHSYLEVEDGKWYDVTEDSSLACCDCGLVHKIEYHVSKSPKGPRIWLRLTRDKRATGAMRRWLKKKLKIRTK